MKNILFVLLGGLFFMAGCDNDSVVGKVHYVYKDYLIDAYISVDELHVNSRQQSLPEIYFSGTVYRSDAQDVAEREEFERLAALHGGRVDREIAIPETYNYDMKLGLFVTYAEDFLSVDVSCDQDWNATHPAGSSLNDVFILSFYSFAPFIYNGNSGYALTEIAKRADEFVEGDLDMLAHRNIRIYSTGRPTPPRSANHYCDLYDQGRAQALGQLRAITRRTQKPNGMTEISRHSVGNFFWSRQIAGKGAKTAPCGKISCPRARFSPLKLLRSEIKRIFVESLSTISALGITNKLALLLLAEIVR